MHNTIDKAHQINRCWQTIVLWLCSILTVFEKLFRALYVSRFHLINIPISSESVYPMNRQLLQSSTDRHKSIGGRPLKSHFPIKVVDCASVKHFLQSWLLSHTLFLSHFVFSLSKVSNDYWKLWTDTWHSNPHVKTHLNWINCWLYIRAFRVDCNVHLMPDFLTTQKLEMFPLNELIVYLSKMTFLFI